MVAPLICATIHEQRLLCQVLAAKAREGNSVSAGSSQASALTCTTTLGEKRAVARSRFVLQTGQAFLKKAFAPLANDLARTERLRDWSLARP